jgi:cell division protein FtsW (lipid II flippase)
LGTGLAQVVSGIMLVRAVGTIHGFFKKNAKESFINLKFMLLHAGAFCLFLLLSLFYYITLGIYLFTPQPHVGAALTYFAIAAFVYTVASFIAQTLLCCIFYDLSVRIQTMPRPKPKAKKVKPQVKLIKKDNKLMREISEEDQKTDESFKMIVVATEDAAL